MAQLDLKFEDDQETAVRMAIETFGPHGRMIERKTLKNHPTVETTYHNHYIMTENGFVVWSGDVDGIEDEAKLCALSGRLNMTLMVVPEMYRFDSRTKMAKANIAAVNGKLYKSRFTPMNG